MPDGLVIHLYRADVDHYPIMRCGTDIEAAGGSRFHQHMSELDSEKFPHFPVNCARCRAVAGPIPIHDLAALDAWLDA